jgi:predicted HTH domain antitoxin
MLMLLGERGVPLDYTAEDAKDDILTLESVLGR